MSFGELITLPYQYEYRGFLAGSGTDVIIEKVDGLLDLPDMDHEMFEREDAHGAFMGTSLMKRRVIDFDFFVVGHASDIEEKIDRFSAAYGFTDTDHEWVFSRRGMPDRFINCRVDKREIPSQYEVANGIAEGSVQLVAGDPRIYSVVERTVTFTIPSGQSSGQALVQAHGNYDSAPRVIITGEADNPHVTNSAEPGKTMGFDFNTGVSGTVEFNSKTRTIYYDRTDYSNLMTFGNDFIKLKPGDNTITVNRSGTVGTATVQVVFRDVWV